MRAWAWEVGGCGAEELAGDGDGDDGLCHCQDLTIRRERSI